MGAMSIFGVAFALLLGKGLLVLARSGWPLPAKLALGAVLASFMFHALYRAFEYRSQRVLLLLGESLERSMGSLGVIVACGFGIAVTKSVVAASLFALVIAVVVGPPVLRAGFEARRTWRRAKGLGNTSDPGPGPVVVVGSSFLGQRQASRLIRSVPKLTRTGLSLFRPDILPVSPVVELFGAERAAALLEESALNVVDLVDDWWNPALEGAELESVSAALPPCVVFRDSDEDTPSFHPGSGLATLRTGLLSRARPGLAAGDRATRTALARFASYMRDTALPLAHDRSALGADGLRAAKWTATEAPTAIASAYLRMYSADSGAGRFVALMDAIDALVGTSRAILVGAAPTDERGAGNPGVGMAWLRDLDPLHVTPLGRLVHDAWSGAAPENLVSAVEAGQSFGFDSGMGLPNSCIQWLDWQRWLRNVTLGHGALVDDRVGPMWPWLHRVFLGLVDRLRPALSGAWAYDGPAGPSELGRGWRRAEGDIQPLPWDGGDWYALRLVHPLGTVPLSPRWMVCGDRPVIQHRALASRVEYRDLRNGALGSRKTPASPRR